MASCLWVVVSLAALVDWSLVALPVVGMVLGVWAWQRVRRNRDTNWPAADWPSAASSPTCAVLVASWVTLSYVHALDVPPGCIAGRLRQVAARPQRAGRTGLGPGAPARRPPRAAEGLCTGRPAHASTSSSLSDARQHVVLLWRQSEADRHGGRFAHRRSRVDLQPGNAAGGRHVSRGPIRGRRRGRQPVYRLDADYLQ